MLVLLCWEHCLATGNHHPLHRHDNLLQMSQCVVMCSTAQLVWITLNSAVNEPRFTILKEHVNVLGMGPLLALVSSGLLSHTASPYGSRNDLRLQQSRPSDLSVLAAASTTDPVNARDGPTLSR